MLIFSIIIEQPISNKNDKNNQSDEEEEFNVTSFDSGSNMQKPTASKSSKQLSQKGLNQGSELNRKKTSQQNMHEYTFNQNNPGGQKMMPPNAHMYGGNPNGMPNYPMGYQAMPGYMHPPIHPQYPMGQNMQHQNMP